MERLNEDEVSSALSTLPEWKLEGAKLVREWVFKDFVAAMHFVNKVAEVAESKGHHPDIDVRYNKVKLGLITHDVGGITVNDTDMARLLNLNL